MSLKALKVIKLLIKIQEKQRINLLLFSQLLKGKYLDFLNAITQNFFLTDFVNKRILHNSTQIVNNTKFCNLKIMEYQIIVDKDNKS